MAWRRKGGRKDVPCNCLRLCRLPEGCRGAVQRSGRADLARRSYQLRHRPRRPERASSRGAATRPVSRDYGGRFRSVVSGLLRLPAAATATANRGRPEKLGVICDYSSRCVAEIGRLGSGWLVCHPGDFGPQKAAAAAETCCFSRSAHRRPRTLRSPRAGRDPWRRRRTPGRCKRASPRTTTTAGAPLAVPLPSALMPHLLSSL